jgi:tetratricopeptide (TPR) repeat protein
VKDADADEVKVAARSAEAALLEMKRLWDAAEEARYSERPDALATAAAYYGDAFDLTLQHFGVSTCSAVMGYNLGRVLHLDFRHSQDPETLAEAIKTYQLSAMLFAEQTDGRGSASSINHLYLHLGSLLHEDGKYDAAYVALEACRNLAFLHANLPSRYDTANKQARVEIRHSFPSAGGVSTTTYQVLWAQASTEMATMFTSALHRHQDAIDIATPIADVADAMSDQMAGSR